MNIVVGGGTGFIGSALCKSLRMAGHKLKIISRNPKGVDNLSWDDVKSSGLPVETNVVINLSGRNIGEVNPLFLFPSAYNAYMKEVFSSRIDTTKLLSEASKSTQLRTFITASAIGFYRPDFDVKFTESEQFVDCGLITQLVREWEAAAQIPGRDDIRQFQLRLGLVLSEDSYFIKTQYLTHRLGLGGAVGSGRQWISWIHLDDVVRAVNFLLSPSCSVSSGPVNVTAPNACRQAFLAKALCGSLGAPSLPFRPPPVPRQLIRLIMGRDRATLLLDGQRVLPQKLLDAGFQFKYPLLEDALYAIFGKRPSPVPLD